MERGGFYKADSGAPHRLARKGAKNQAVEIWWVDSHNSQN